MTERFIQSPNGNLFYCISRHGNPFAGCIVFLHGVSSDHTLFDKQSSYFSKKNTVIAWDSPAHGKSRPYSDLSYKSAAAALRSVMDAEGIDTAVLVGHSTGGIIAQLFAEEYPERVSGLVGIDTYPLDASLYSSSDLRLLKRSFYRNICSAPDVFTKRELRSVLKQSYSEFLSSLHDISLECPVLLLVGERDKTGKILKSNREWAKKHGCPMHILPAAAHNSCADDPNACNSRLDAFIASLSSESDTSV